jgi:hypothetical protein
MKMAKMATNPLYEELASSTRGYGERNDCTVKALAVAARIPYEEAHKTLRGYGRRNGHGFYHTFIVKDLKARGFKVEPIDPALFVRKNYPRGKNGYTTITMRHFADFQSVFGNRRFLVKVRGHVATYDGSNGLIDWSANRSLRVSAFYEIIG